MAHFKPWPVKLKRVINSHSKMTLSSLSSEEVRRPYQKRKVATHTCMCIHLYAHSYYLVFICNEGVKLRAMYLSQKKKKPRAKKNKFNGIQVWEGKNCLSGFQVGNMVMEIVVAYNWWCYFACVSTIIYNLACQMNL